MCGLGCGSPPALSWWSPSSVILSGWPFFRLPHRSKQAPLPISSRSSSYIDANDAESKQPRPFVSWLRWQIARGNREKIQIWNSDNKGPGGFFIRPKRDIIISFPLTNSNTFFVPDFRTLACHGHERRGEQTKTPFIAWSGN